MSIDINVMLLFDLRELVFKSRIEYKSLILTGFIFPYF